MTATSNEAIRRSHVRFRGARAALTARWRRLDQEAVVREAERRLRAAPEAILRDLGIDRNDIGAAVRHGRERFGGR